MSSIMLKVEEKYFVPNRDARDIVDMNKLASKAKGDAKACYRLDIYGRSWKQESARRMLLEQLKEINIWVWKQELRLGIVGGVRSSVSRF